MPRGREGKAVQIIVDDGGKLLAQDSSYFGISQVS